MTRVDFAAAVFAPGAERICDLAMDLAVILGSLLASASEAALPEGQPQ
ncbi:hypothetical protein [Bradyrhizobium macuxiense]|nr:hypothetical protein [Bradyrhizobium macuxiense]